MSDTPPDGYTPYRSLDELGYETVRTSRFSTPKALVFLGIFLAVVAVGGLFAKRWVDHQLNPPGPPGDVVVLALGEGDTASTIASDLEGSGIIPNADVYRWYVRIKGGPAFQAGEYEFQANSAAWDVLDVLAAGPARVAQAVTFDVLIPPGLTVAEIIQEVEQADLPYGAAEFQASLRSGLHISPFWPEDLTALPEGSEYYEGMLFPDTYDVQAGEEAGLLIERMLRRFEGIATAVGLQSSEEAVGLTPYETVIVASLIEREAKVPEDRAKISRVIYNRLFLGWPLGIDATVVYATGDNEITQSDIDSDSPWNTRRFPGLPPTPIAAPSRASLEAALAPEEGPWLYYVLTDPNGSHSFAETEEEFLRYKAICENRGLCG